MSVVADFLKGTVSESLTKLFQPAGVVPATIFVLLNLGFVYPAALEDEVGIAVAYSDLREFWQVVVVASLILSLGYLLLNAANWILDLLSGQISGLSELAYVLRKLQLRQHAVLQQRIDKRRGGDNPSAGWYQMATRFPTTDPVHQYIQPTRLGNALLATRDIISRRYGIDITTLWAQMEAVDGIKDAPALEGVKDEKATLDLLLNLTFVLAVFGLQAHVYFAIWEDWDAAVKSLLVLPLAYLVYRIAVNAARAWGNAVEVTLDLHRGDLRKELGIREPKDFADERRLWENARIVYLPGSRLEPAPDLFRAVVPATADVTSAAPLEVERVRADLVDVSGESAGTEFLLRYVDYLFVVSGAKPAFYGPGADFLVDDRRIARVDTLPQAVTNGAIKAEASEHASDVGTVLRWRVTGLSFGTSLTVGYRLPLWRLVVTGAGNARLTSQKDGHVLTIPGVGGDKVSLSFRSYAPETSPPVVKLGSKAITLVPGRGVYEARDIAIPTRNPPFWITLPGRVAS
jgi:hypothetical protein